MSIRRDRPVVAAIATFVMVALLLAPVAPSVAQDAGPAASTVSAIDLATVPLLPDDLPESGFQLVQAGDMELSALQYAWSGDGLDEDEWTPIAGHFTQSYSMVLDLLSDREDASSESIAHLLTTVMVLDSARSVAPARDAALDIFAIDADDTEEIDGVVTYEDQQGIIGLGVCGRCPDRRPVLLLRPAVLDPPEHGGLDPGDRRRSY